MLSKVSNQVRTAVMKTNQQMEEQGVQCKDVKKLDEKIQRSLEDIHHRMQEA